MKKTQVAVTALILFALGFFISITHGFSIADESWFLQVLHRVMSGDILYRDVFFGSTPLSVYIFSAFTNIFGAEILVVKAVTELFFVLTVYLTWQIARQLGLVQSFPLLLILALFVYTPHNATAPYSPFANLFLLACFSSALSWRERLINETEANDKKSLRALAVAGIAAGLCFASKQNLGLYALTALLVTIVINYQCIQLSRQRLLACVMLAVASFLLTAFIVFLPVILSGGLEKLVDYGFLNKGTYMRFAKVPYLEGFREIAVFLTPSVSIEGLKQIYIRALFLLPLLTFPLIFVILLRSDSEKRNLTAMVLLFVGAAFLGVFPRADYFHMTYALPELLIGLAFAWHWIKPVRAANWASFLRAGLILWLGFGLGFLLLNPLAKIMSGEYQASQLPHFRGPLVQTVQHKRISAYAEILSRSAGDEHPFFLSPSAGFYYLITGLKNPTPFDYPLVTAFGRNGEEETIESISRGEIRTIFVEDNETSSMSPVRLERYVRENMEQSHNVGFFTLYRTRKSFK